MLTIGAIENIVKIKNCESGKVSILLEGKTKFQNYSVPKYHSMIPQVTNYFERLRVRYIFYTIIGKLKWEYSFQKLSMEIVDNYLGLTIL